MAHAESMTTKTKRADGAAPGAVQACPHCGSFTITTSAALAAQVAQQGRCGSCAFGGAE